MCTFLTIYSKKKTIIKTFADEADCVKLQALNLAVKLWSTSETHRQGKCGLLIKYVFQLARYDPSYDIRDRCRFLRNYIFNDGVKFFPLEIFLAQKPAPVLLNQFADHECFQLGTLSHLLKKKCTDYKELPGFPEQQPDPSIRRNACPLKDDELTGKYKNEHNCNELETTDSNDDEEMDEEDEIEEQEDEGIFPIFCYSKNEKLLSTVSFLISISFILFIY